MSFTFIPSSLSDDRPESYWIRATCFLLIGLLFIRIGYLLIFPADLAGDESYYWDWSRQLDWSYYSKPPMIAWIIWLGTRLGSTLFLIKLPAALLNVATIGILGLLAKRLYSAKVAFWSVLISATMPGTAIGGMTMTIDAPLLFFWAAALLFVWNALSPEASEGSRKASGVLAVIAVGLGLITKLSMAAFWVGIPLLILFPRTNKSALSFARWGVWMISSFLFLIPFLLWNWQRDWITFQHTGTSFGVNQWEWQEAFVRSLDFLVSQLGALNPVWWVGILGLCFITVFKWRRLKFRAQFLVAFSVPLIFGGILLSFYQRVQPNWPAAFYLGATILLAAWLCGEPLFQKEKGVQEKRRWKQTGLYLGAILVVLIYMAPFAWDWAGYAGHRSDPFARIRGWKGFAGDVQQVREATFNGTPHFIWVAGHRYPVSQLAFYLPDQPHLFRYEPEEFIYSQYEMWPGPRESGYVGEDALLLIPPELREAQLPKWATQFKHILPLGEIHYPVGNGRSIQMLVYRGVELKEGVPAPEVREYHQGEQDASVHDHSEMQEESP